MSAASQRPSSMPPPPEILVVGASHQTAPIAIREQLAVPDDAARGHLTEWRSRARSEEMVFVSTCNRVELYMATSDPRASMDAARAVYSERVPSAATHLYGLSGEEAIRHTFRVAASLDSLVVGEPQILGQMKNALAVARDAGTTGPLLDRCFSRAFSVAKRVRHDTGIGMGSVSVGSVACELATRVFESLAKKRVALVGAGKMSEAAAKRLRTEGATVAVVNRSLERAQSLARAISGEAKTLDGLPHELVHADVILCSTASPTYVVTYESLRDAMRARRRRMLVIIDVAVPRNVDPRVAELDNVFLYDIDDLKKVADENLERRRGQAAAAESIVRAEVVAFEKWRRGLFLAPTIAQLNARVRETARAELIRAVPKLASLSDEERAALDTAIDAIAAKLLHAPTTELRRAVDSGESPELVDAARRLFGLSVPPPKDEEGDR